MPKANLNITWSYQGSGYGPGETDIPDGLYEILADKGYIESENPAVRAANYYLEDMKVPELRELADEKGIDHAGLKKAELVSVLKGGEDAES